MKIISVLTITFTLLLAACDQSKPYVQLSGYTMGTTYQVTLEKSSIDPAQLQKEIDARLQIINQLMSTYIDNSELSLFNQSQSTKCQPLSQDTLFVIRNALEISRQTQGKFDITLAPLIEIWGFDKKETNNQIPSSIQIAELLQTIGHKKLEPDTNCLTKMSTDLSVNLSAIAKGYAVDEIANIIASHRVNNYLVEIGGELATRGINAKGQSWRIAIESASTMTRRIQRVVSPNGLGMATSGDYRNYFEKNGKRFSHTIDPTSGYPIEHRLASVTVLHKSTMLADAWATAFMVMGPEASLELANQQQLAIFMLVKSAQGFEEIYSEAFATYLQ